MVGNTGYATLAGAIEAADDGATITIIKAGEYDALPALTKTLTFVPSVDGVIINQTTNTEIDAEKTVTFKNIAFNLSDVLYLGFGKKSDSANGALVMEGCTIEGSLSLYGMSTFTDCKFTANGKYNIWAVLTGASFSGCSFTNTNRAVNVYDFKYGSSVKNVSFSGCTFAGTAKKKAAINIHHNPDGTAAKYAVTITDCTTSGTWASSVEETGEPASATVCYSPLWMVSDINGALSSDITVTVDGVAQAFNPVAKIGNVNYATLAEAVAAAQDKDTITILQDFALTTVSETILGAPSTKYNVVISKSITIDGDNHVITASNDERALGFDGENTQVTIKDLTIKANPTKAKDATLWICNNVNLTLDNVVVDGTSASHSATYNQPITIGSGVSGRPTLNIINGSVVKTNNDATAHYAIIVASPSDINVSNSTLKGYAAVYVKPQATGTIVNVSNSDVESHGYSGVSNAFGMFVTESDNNTFTLTSNNYSITAGDQYQVLTELNSTKGNVVKLLGTSKFTTNDVALGTLVSNWDQYYVNSLYMDDANKETFENHISSECTVVKETSGVYNGLWKVTGPTPEVYYYWDTNKGQQGGYYHLADPFDKGWLSDGEYIDVLKNITLTKTIACKLTSGSFRFNLAENTVTKGNYSITLRTGVSVVTDKDTDIFTAADGNAVIVETEENGSYTYSAVAATAAIGTTNYATLVEAVAAVADGQTIKLLADVTYDDGIIYNKEGVSAELDLNGKTLTVNTGSNANNRAIRIDNGTLEVYGGSIVAVGSGTTSSDGTGCYGAFRVEAAGKLVAHDLSLTNSRPWGLNVKVLGGEAELTNVNITSSYGGGIEVTEQTLGGQSKKGKATLTNCTFDQKNYYDHCSTPISVSGGSELTVDGGTYTSENHVLYVFSSGGVITVNDGTFNATGSKAAIVAAIDLNTYPTYTGGLQIKGGNYTGSYSITSPAYMSITGGTFTEDPSAYVADGYAATHNGNVWVVEKESSIEVGGNSGRTLAEAVALVKDANGGSIKLIGDVNVSSYIRIEAPTILDLNGHTITASCPLFNYVTADLTIKDSQGNGKMDVNVGSDRYGIYSSTSGVKIKLEGGTLSASSSNGSFIHAVSLSSGATFEMSGGKITVPATSTAKTTANYCIELGSGCSAVINGGEIVCEGAGNNYAIGNSGTVTINAGSITAKYGSDNWGLATSPYVLYGSGTYTVNGGYIKAIGNEGQSAPGHFVGNSNNGKTSITGGYFGAVYSNWNEVSVNSTIASGYKRRVLTENEANATDAAAYAAGYQAIVEAQ